MDDPLDAARLYLRLIRARLRGQLQYRTSFVLDVIGTFVISFIDFLAILIIFSNVPQLGSWSVSEVALLYGMACLSFAVTDLVVGHLDLFPRTVRDGTFDLVLVRPRPALLMVLSADFQVRRLGRIAQSVVVLVYALTTLHIEWTAERAVVLLAAIVTGSLIFVAIWVAVICVTFWTVDGGEAANAFTYGGVTLAQYPIGIYDPWLRRFFAYLVPVAFVAYFPALFILGKTDPLGFPVWMSFLSPLVAVAAGAVALAVWRTAVRHYRSAGG